MQDSTNPPQTNEQLAATPPGDPPQEVVGGSGGGFFEPVAITLLLLVLVGVIANLVLMIRGQASASAPSNKRIRAPRLKLGRKDHGGLIDAKQEAIRSARAIDRSRESGVVPEVLGLVVQQLRLPRGLRDIESLHRLESQIKEALAASEVKPLSREGTPSERRVISLGPLESRDRHVSGWRLPSGDVIPSLRVDVENISQVFEGCLDQETRERVEALLRLEGGLNERFTELLLYALASRADARALREALSGKLGRALQEARGMREILRTSFGRLWEVHDEIEAIELLSVTDVEEHPELSLPGLVSSVHGLRLPPIRVIPCVQPAFLAWITDDSASELLQRMGLGESEVKQLVRRAANELHVWKIGLQPSRSEADQKGAQSGARLYDRVQGRILDEFSELSRCYLLRNEHVQAWAEFTAQGQALLPERRETVGQDGGADIEFATLSPSTPARCEHPSGVCIVARSADSWERPVLNLLDQLAPACREDHRKCLERIGGSIRRLRTSEPHSTECQRAAASYWTGVCELARSIEGFSFESIEANSLLRSLSEPLKSAGFKIIHGDTSRSDWFSESNVERAYQPALVTRKLELIAQGVHSEEPHVRSAMASAGWSADRPGESDEVGGSPSQGRDSESARVQFAPASAEAPDESTDAPEQRDLDSAQIPGTPREGGLYHERDRREAAGRADAPPG